MATNSKTLPNKLSNDPTNTSLQQNLALLNSMFVPQLSESLIAEVLHQCRGNMDAAIQELMEMSQKIEKMEEARHEDEEEFKHHHSISTWFSNGLKKVFSVEDKPTEKLDPTDKGLQNYTGENNCFLNVVIQTLWHLSPFRKQFHKVGSHCHSLDSGSEAACIFCALNLIFTQFEFSEEDVLPPTALRQALSVLYLNKFQLGKMDDAAEVYDALLTSLHCAIEGTPHGVLKVCDPPCLIHRLFGLRIKEYVQCHLCGLHSKVTKFNTFINYVPVEALRMCAMQNLSVNKDGGVDFSISLARAIRRVNHTDVRICEHCNNNGNICRAITAPLPEVFTLGFVWSTESAATVNIAEIMQLIDTKMSLRKVFDEVEGRHTSYVLRGMICIYAKHYVAFLKNAKLKQWLMFDDVTVKKVGNWTDVSTKCKNGRFQPFMLFYERKV